MKDEEYREKKDAVGRIINELKQGEVSDEDAEELLQEALEHISEARELLDVGSGKVEVLE